MAKKDILDELKNLGYTGPVSYNTAKLDAILQNEKAKASAKVPTGKKKPLLAYLNVQKDYDAKVLFELQHAYAEMNPLLKQMEGKGNVSSQMRRAQIEAAQEAMQARLGDAWTKVGSTVQAGKVEASQVATNYMANSANIFKKAGFTDGEVAMLQDSLRTTAKINLTHLESRLKYSKQPLAASVWGSEQLVHDRLDYLINTHIARGTSARELAASVRDFVNPATPGGVKYAAMRLARTELNNSFHATTVEVASQLPFVEGLKWMLSGSHPIPDECDEYAGEEPFLPKDTPPKPHPNCLCYVIEMLPSSDDFLKSFQNGDYDNWLNGTSPKVAIKHAKDVTPATEEWLGKDKPTSPTPPIAPVEEVDFNDLITETGSSMPDWLKAVTKKDLDAGLSYYTKHITNGNLKADMVAKYRAMVAARKSGAALGTAADVAAYPKKLAEFQRQLKQYDKDIAAWMKANGIKAGELHGMKHGKKLTTAAEGLEWANRNLHVAPEGTHRSALKRYTGSSYSEWNSALRANASTAPPAGSWSSWTKRADAGFKPAGAAFIAQRGTTFQEFLNPTGTRTSMWPPPNPKDLVGSVHVQHGYMSTSAGPAAFSFNKVQMRIMVPETHGVSWVEPYSSHRGEREVLLERGTQVYVHDVYEENGKWIVEAEALPPGVNPLEYRNSRPMPSGDSPT